MGIIVLRLEDTNYTYSDVVNLLHEAFQERLEQGLRYTCSFITEEQLKKKTEKGIILVAKEEDSGALVGTMTLNFPDMIHEKFGYMEYVAVSSSVKTSGIGTMLFTHLQELAIQNGCAYLLSDTSTQAVSAVRWHQKLGYKIIGLESYRSTNYWSYVFRKQLVPSRRWDNEVYCKWHYMKSWFFIRTTRDINGNDTSIGNIYKALKRKCKN